MQKPSQNSMESAAHVAKSAARPGCRIAPSVRRECLQTKAPITPTCSVNQAKAANVPSRKVGDLAFPTSSGSRSESCGASPKVKQHVSKLSSDPQQKSRLDLLCSRNPLADAFAARAAELHTGEKHLYGTLLPVSFALLARERRPQWIKEGSGSAVFFDVVNKTDEPIFLTGLTADFRCDVHEGEAKKTADFLSDIHEGRVKKIPSATHRNYYEHEAIKILKDKVTLFACTEGESSGHETVKADWQVLWSGMWKKTSSKSLGLPVFLRLSPHATQGLLLVSKYWSIGGDNALFFHMKRAMERAEDDNIRTSLPKRFDEAARHQFLFSAVHGFISYACGSSYLITCHATESNDDGLTHVTCCNMAGKELVILAVEPSEYVSKLRERIGALLSSELSEAAPLQLVTPNGTLMSNETAIADALLAGKQGFTMPEVEPSERPL